MPAPNWERVKARPVNAPTLAGPHLHVLIKKMQEDGMLWRLPGNIPSNGAVFAKKKNVDKAALLFDCRPMNVRCAGDPAPPRPSHPREAGRIHCPHACP